MPLRQAVILCGGLGTRLHPYTLHIPKPMIPTNGRPFLTYIIEQLAEQGIREIVLLTGYRGEQIEEYFGDGRRFNVDISYSRGPVEWETARRVWEARKFLQCEFMLLYSDNYVPINIARLYAHHHKCTKPVTVSLCRKTHGNIRLNPDGVIAAYDSARRQKGLDYVEVGYMVCHRERLLDLIHDPDCSFSRILEELAATENLAGNILLDRYHSIGDPVRWKEAEDYLAIKRIILLDRDGTLNSRAPAGEYISHWSKCFWLPGVREALKKLSGVGFSFAIITNQAGVARGIVTPAELDEIHSRMISVLAQDGITIRGVYVCPHHWDDGCDCRKPKPGMLLQASRDLNLRLDRTIYVGDDARDCDTAYAAACLSGFVGNVDELKLTAIRPDFLGASLEEIVPWVQEVFDRWERMIWTSHNSMDRLPRCP